MGFERVAGIIQNTRSFTSFNRVISNYETDIFRPLFDKLERLSGKQYSSTLPAAGTTGSTDAEKTDVAFRVIADHVRTLSFAIADGIQPGNNDRNYVLRRILRRAVRYGRSLGFHEPFFYKLVDVVADTMGEVFPGIQEKRTHVQNVIRTEEEAFNKTLDRGIEMFNKEVAQTSQLSGDFTFKLYDTYGFPLDLTELMARERGLTVDVARFNTLMEEQRALARAAQKKEVISLSEIKTTVPTQFVGYERLDTPTRAVEVVRLKNKTAVILDTSSCYPEMGGQIGDTGELSGSGQLWRIVNTQKSGQAWLHILEDDESPPIDSPLHLQVNVSRRQAIERHHTVTHILHWALHEIAGKDVAQKGSFVGPDKLTFDFNCAPLSAEQIVDIEKLVNERILENNVVSWTEVPYAEVKSRPDVMQFFGDKYGDQVRVVQIGGVSGSLDGYSMELCGGTHTRATGQVGLFRVLGESAIAAGVRRIEAVAGLEAYHESVRQDQLVHSLASKLNTPVTELERKLDTLLTQQKALEKQLRSFRQREASAIARNLQASASEIPPTDSRPGMQLITQDLDAAEGDFLQDIADALKPTFKGVTVLAGRSDKNVSLLATVSPELTKHIQAGKIIQAIAPIIGGRGGGRPDNARGGGKDATKIPEALSKVRSLLSGSTQ
jgi:alanyl-tRNA synthetase